jgi:putative membrane protein
MSELNLEQKYNKWIIAVSIIIPVAVAFLLELNLKILVMMLTSSFLPPIRHYKWYYSGVVDRWCHFY